MGDRIRDARAVLLSLACAQASMVAVQDGAPAPQPDRAYVSVVDHSGQAVAGLTEQDFVVEVNGGPQLVLDARRTTEPVSVAFVVDVTPADLPYVRAAMRAIVARMTAAQTEIRASWVLPREPPAVFIGVSDPLSELSNVTTPVMNGYHVRPALLEAAKALQKEDSPRHVVFTVDRLARDQPDESYVQQVSAALRGSQSALWSVAIRTSVLDTEGRAERELQRIAKISGGLREVINSPVPLESVATKLTAMILSQYVLTYPSSRSQPREVRIGVKRSGVKVFAPAW